MGLLLDDGPLALWRIEQGHVLDVLRRMPDKHFQMCATSPPYFGLRDYGLPPTMWGDGWEGCLGLEPTPEMFVGHLVEVFSEVRRMLRDDGTLWVVIGDSYAGSWGNQGRKKDRGTQRPINGEMLTPVLDGRYPDKISNTGKIPDGANYKSKDLLLIPSQLALALRADGWYLRDDIVWAKPNPMPGSQKDRCTSSYEHVLMLSKKSKYYFDYVAIQEPAVGQNAHDLTGQAYKAPGQPVQTGNRNGHMPKNGAMRTKRNVWTVATVPFPDAHFAVFPPKLIEPMILAGSARQACAVCGAPWKRVVEHGKMEWEPSESREEARAGSPVGTSGERTVLRGTMTKAPTTTTTGWDPTCEHDDGGGRSVILDPFAGAGTTGLVSVQHGRNFVGIEQSGMFCEMARARIAGKAPINSAPDVRGNLLSDRFGTESAHREEI